MGPAGGINTSLTAELSRSLGVFVGPTFSADDSIKRKMRATKGCVYATLLQTEGHLRLQTKSTELFSFFVPRSFARGPADGMKGSERGGAATGSSLSRLFVFVCAFDAKAENNYG